MVVKRGVLFSLLSILTSVFLILLFWNANSARLDSHLAPVATRVSVIDSYIYTLDQYADDAVRLSTRAALINLTRLLQNKKSEESVEQMVANLSSCLATGSTSGFEGLQGSIWCAPTLGESFIGELNNFTTIAKEELGININYTLSAFTIEDWAPFQLHVTFVMNYTINDTFSFWNRSVRHDVIVSVEGLPDPLFARYGETYLISGTTKRNITKFPLERELFTPENVSDLISEQAYVANPGMAPAYLERLAGIVTPPFDTAAKAGIETLIDPDITTITSQERLNLSDTAHQLFHNERYRCGNQTFGILNSDYPAFHLNVAHLVRYNIIDPNLYNRTCE